MAEGSKPSIVRKQIRTAVFFLILPCWLPSCSSSKKLSTPAMTLHVADTLPTLPVSEIDLPLKIAGKPLLDLADSIVPKEFTSEGWPAYLQASCDFRYKYRFVRSGFVLGCINNHLTLQMKGSYQVGGSRCLCALGKPVSPWITGNCGMGAEPMRRVDLALSSLLNFQPDYRIRTQTRLDQLKALDKCVVSLFSMDMTGQILDSIRSSINGFCRTFDETISGLDFSGYLHQTAARAWQRTPIGPYGYLSVNPSAIRIGTLNYSRDSLSINVGVSCRPELVSDSNKKTMAAPILPPLSAAGVHNGLAIYLPVSYDYGFITKIANDSLRNRSFLFKGRTVIIKEVAFKGIGHHQVEIRIDFAGSRKGRLYLRGTPVLDTAKQALNVPDISYTLESRDLALKMARSLLRNKIRKSLRGNSYLDLAALLKANMPSLDAQMNRQLAPN